jgi:hypothetical protein
MFSIIGIILNFATIFLLAGSDYYTTNCIIYRFFSVQNGEIFDRIKLNYIGTFAYLLL